MPKPLAKFFRQPLADDDSIVRWLIKVDSRTVDQQALLDRMHIGLEVRRVAGAARIVAGKFCG